MSSGKAYFKPGKRRTFSVEKSIGKTARGERPPIPRKSFGDVKGGTFNFRMGRLEGKKEKKLSSRGGGKRKPA